MEKPANGDELWLSLTSGDRDAFHRIYQEHYVGLMNYGALYFRDRGIINDAIIKMLLDLWDRRASLPPIKNTRSYLISCLRNIILQRIKTQKWKDSKIDAIVNDLDQNQPSYEEHLTMFQDNEQLKLKLHKSFEKLSPRQRELLQLRFFDNRSYEEIAEQCNITKRTAYNIIHDAIKILRAELNDGQNNISMHDIVLLISSIMITWSVIKH